MKLKLKKKVEPLTLEQEMAHMLLELYGKKPDPKVYPLLSDVKSRVENQKKRSDI